MKRKIIRYRAFRYNPWYKGPWRNTMEEARADASQHTNSIVQYVEMGSPVKIRIV